MFSELNKQFCFDKKSTDSPYQLCQTYMFNQQPIYYEFQIQSQKESCVNDSLVVVIEWEDCCLKGRYLNLLNCRCNSKCGDGYKIYQQCDDGNKIDGDGCSSDCKVEKGYICDGDQRQMSKCQLKLNITVKNIRKDPYSNSFTMEFEVFDFNERFVNVNLNQILKIKYINVTLKEWFYNYQDKQSPACLILLFTYQKIDLNEKWAYFLFVFQQSPEQPAVKSQWIMVKMRPQSKLAFEYYSEQVYSSTNSIKIVMRICVIMAYGMLILFPFEIKPVVLNLFTILQFIFVLGLKKININPLTYAMLQELQYTVGISWDTLVSSYEQRNIDNINASANVIFQINISLSICSFVVLLCIIVIAISRIINTSCNIILYLSGLFIIFFMFNLGLNFGFELLLNIDSLSVRIAKCGYILLLVLAGIILFRKYYSCFETEQVNTKFSILHQVFKFIFGVVSMSQNELLFFLVGFLYLTIFLFAVFENKSSAREYFFFLWIIDTYVLIIIYFSKVICQATVEKYQGFETYSKIVFVVFCVSAYLVINLKIKTIKKIHRISQKRVFQQKEMKIDLRHVQITKRQEKGTENNKVRDSEKERNADENSLSELVNPDIALISIP